MGLGRLFEEDRKLQWNTWLIWRVSWDQGVDGTVPFVLESSITLVPIACFFRHQISSVPSWAS